MSETQFEPMSVGGILDQTFRLYRKHFVRFLAIVAVVQVPMALIVLAVVAPLASSTQQSEEIRFVGPDEVPFGSNAEATGFAREPGTTEPQITGVMVFGGLIALFLAILAANLCNAALIKSISESYLGNDVSIGAAYGFILPKVVTIIVAQFLVGLIVGCGFVLLIVPGVIFLTWYALVTQVIVIENLGVMAAARRSKELTKGNRGKVLSVIVLVGILGAIIGFALGLFGELIAALVPQGSGMTLMVIRQIIEIAGNVLAAPIGAAAMILLYYDMRIRKEGFDLEMLSRTMSAEALPSDSDVPIE